MLNSLVDSKHIQGTRNKEKVLLVACCLIIAIILLHIGFLENKFIDGDDLTRIVQNPLIRNITLTGFGRDIKGFFLYHYPSFLLTYYWGLIFSVWELNHIGFHFVSFLLHALCTGLLFLLLIRMTNKLIPALIGALFFGFHPLHCEAVNWISRQDMMLTVFFGLLYLHMDFLKGSYARILSAIFVVLSIFVSPVSILLIPARYFIAGDSGKTPSWKGTAALIVLWAGTWGIKLPPVSPLKVTSGALRAVFWLAQDLFMPWKIRFMLPVLSTGAWMVWGISMVLIAGVVVIALKTGNKAWKLLGLGLLSFGLLHLFSDRFNGGYAYFSLLWTTLALGTAISEIEITAVSWKVGLSILAVAIFSAMAWMSYSRNGVWRNTDHLLTDSLKASPTDGWLLAMLGHYKAAFLNRKETERIFKKVKTDSPEILCLKAKATHLLLDNAESNRLFQELFRKYPQMKKDKFCLFDYAVLHVQMKKVEKAKKLFREVVGIDPFFIYAWHNLGTLFFEEKKWTEGIKSLGKVLDIAPAYRPTLENMAIFYSEKGRWKKAASCIQTALASTSCHDTQRFYKGWLKALKAEKPYRYASIQWADLKPPG